MQELTINAETVSRETKVGTVTTSEDKSLTSFYEKMSGGALFDTGILPLEGTGVLAIRQAGNHTQFVFQHKPDVYRVIWGRSERDPSAKNYYVAQPYRIVIGDHMDGELLGARHFYSPVPITMPGQPLYHCNVPNLNCKGYRGTSVGWICLYRRNNYGGLDLGQKINQTIVRASGDEAYNDANMSSTDGARFYQNAGKPKYTWDPTAWEAKTKKDGVDWVLDQDLWIPIKVTDMDHQDAHDPNGVPFTLEMAMLGEYHAYYTDAKELKMINRFARDDVDAPTGEEIHTKVIAPAFASAEKTAAKAKPKIKTTTIPGVTGTVKTTKVAKKTTATKKTAAKKTAAVKKNLSDTGNITVTVPFVPPANMKNCMHCGWAFNENNVTAVVGGSICGACSMSGHLVECKCCSKNQYKSNTFLHTDGWLYCFDKNTVSPCFNCGKVYLNPSANELRPDGCISCDTYTPCAVCGAKTHPESLNDVVVKGETYKLCSPCEDSSVICACGLLKGEAEVGEVGLGVYACGPCINYQDDGTPIYQSNVSISA
jgi:hypothetical protein